MLWVTLTLIVQDVLTADVAVKILAGHVHVSVPPTGLLTFKDPTVFIMRSEFSLGGGH